jgi:hypothetical protein
MIQKIQPVISSFRFGQADTLKIELQQDNLVDHAVFSVRIGKINPDHVLNPIMSINQDGFIADEPSLQYVTLSGADYAAWDGSNQSVAALVVAQLPGITAA